MIDTSREAVSIDSAISWARSCAVSCRARRDVVENDQRESGDRITGIVAGHESAQKVVQLGAFRVLRQHGQPERDLGVGDRVEAEPRVGRREVNELDVSIQRFVDQEWLHRRVADDGGLQVPDRPEGFSGEDVALGQYLDDPQVGRGRELSRMALVASARSLSAGRKMLVVSTGPSGRS